MFKTNEIFTVTEEVIHPESREVLLEPGDRVERSTLQWAAARHGFDNVKVKVGRKSRRLFFYEQGTFNPGPAIVGWFRPSSL